jgi:hypothetical protein
MIESHLLHCLLIGLFCKDMAMLYTTSMPGLRSRVLASHVLGYPGVLLGI